MFKSVRSARWAWGKVLHPAVTDGTQTLAVLRLGTTGELVALPISSPGSMCSANGREVGERAASPQHPAPHRCLISDQRRKDQNCVLRALLADSAVCARPKLSSAWRSAPPRGKSADRLHHRLCCEDSAPMVPCDEGRDSIPHGHRDCSGIMPGLLSMLQRVYLLWDVLGAPFLSLSRLG